MRAALRERSTGWERHEIAALLPHGDAFLFIDRAQSPTRGRLVATFRWDSERPDIAAHFAVGPKLVPAVLIAEQGAQAALLLAAVEGRSRPDSVLVLGQLRLDVLRPAYAPCIVVADVSIDALVGDGIGFRAVCSVGETVVARVRGIASALRRHEP